MSLGNGIRFRSTDLLEVHQQLMAFRPVIADLAEKKETEFLARTAVRSIDKAILKGTPCNAPLSEALQELWDRQRKIVTTRKRDPQIDMEFKVLVLPWAGRIYGLVYSERGEWIDLLREQDWVEDFRYWTNADAPDDMSHEEWDERGCVWGAILEQDPARRPGASGMTADFMPDGGIPQVEDVLRFVPTIDERARKWAFERVRARRFATLMERNTMDDGTLEKEKDPIRAVIEAAEFAEKEGAPQVEAEFGRIRLLLPEITRELLLDGCKVSPDGGVSTIVENAQSGEIA